MLRAGAGCGAAALVAPAPGAAQADPLGAPALSLDFSARVPDGVAFSRATPGWLPVVDGATRVIAANEPRFLHDPGTRRAQGLLIEGDAANALPHGSDFARWKTPGDSAIAPAPDVPAPDGGRGAWRVRAGESRKIDQGVLQWSTRTGGEGFLAASVYVRAVQPGTRTRWALAAFDYQTYAQQREVAEIGDRWTRIVAAGPWYAADAGAKVVNLAAPLPAGAEGAREILVWGAQLEPGRAATTLAGLGENSLARRADVVLADLSPLAGAEGTIRLVLPRGAARDGVLLDAGGVVLAIDANGRVEGRAGRLELAGLGDASADTEFEIAWWADGAAIRSGAGGGALTPRARASGSPGAVAPAAKSRLLSDADGKRPLNASLLSLSGWRRARPSPPPERISYAPRLYELALGDDFDDPDVTRINENAVKTGRAPAWRSRYRQDRWTIINKEKQIYVDREFRGSSPTPLGVQPFAIRDSVLTITADRADPQRVRPFVKNIAYTSGCITSELTFWQQYGYFEISCRCPLGKGFWPAFWLLPKRVGWPPEIDPLEASGVKRYSVHQGTVVGKEHADYKKAYPPRWVDGVVDIAKGFNVYAVEWTEKEIVFSINGAETIRQPNVIHEPMYVLANLALGSHEPKWIPDPDASTPFPGRFEIDWIRVYKSTRS